MSLGFRCQSDWHGHCWICGSCTGPRLGRPGFSLNVSHCGNRRQRGREKASSSCFCEVSDAAKFQTAYWSRDGIGNTQGFGRDSATCTHADAYRRRGVSVILKFIRVSTASFQHRNCLTLHNRVPYACLRTAACISADETADTMDIAHANQLHFKSVCRI